MQHRSLGSIFPRLFLSAALFLLCAGRVAADTDVGIELSASTTSPGIGDTFTISVTATNAGPDDATGLELYNQFPVGLVFLSSTAPAYNPTTSVWNAGFLAAGASTTLTVQLFVPYPSEATPISFGDTLTDFASVNLMDQTDTFPDNNLGSLDVTITAHPRTLTIVSAHGAPSPAVGVYTNLAGTALTPSVASPVTEGGTQYVCTGWTMTGGNPPATGTTNAFSMTVYQDAVLTWQWTAVEATDVKITKAVSPSVTTNSGSVAFTITASNVSTRAAAGLVVSDVLPGVLQLTGASSTNYNTGNGAWTIGGLPAGAATSLVLSVLVTAENGVAVTNHAAISALISTDTNAANNAAAATVTVSAALVPLTVVSAHGAPVPPAGVTLLPVSAVVNASVPSPTLDGSTQYICTGWTLTGHSPASGTSNNFAFTILTNATLTWLWQAVSAPELDVAKTVNNATPSHGEPITYVVSVTNRGNAAASGIVVTDSLPAGLVWQSSTPGYDPVAGRWPVGSLAAGVGTAITVTAVAPLPQSYGLAVTLTNPSPLAIDNFGHALADAAGAVLVGAPGHPSGHPAGLAYLMATDGTLLQTITNPAPGSGERFGDAVAAVGGRLAIAAPGDPAGSLFGSVYLYNATGALVTTIANPTPEVLDQFGEVLAAVGSNRLVIGASHEPAGANAGAAYLYDLNGVLQATITNAGVGPGDRFGAALSSVGSSGVLVGAPGAPLGNEVGEAYLFNVNGAKLVTFTNPAAAAGDLFGFAVAGVAGNKVLVGAPQAPAGAEIGAAYLFSTNGGLLAAFTNPAPASYRHFGAALADLGGSRIAIGALGGPGGGLAGAVLIYDLGGNLLHTFTNPSGGTNENFAADLAAIAGRLVAVGASSYSGAATGQGLARLFRLEFPELNGLTLTNTAAVTLDQVDPLPGNNTASAEILFAYSYRTLTIASEHGTPSPPVGVHTNPVGLEITNSCPASVVVGSNQFVCVGWTMSGNSPATGSGNSMTMVPTNNAVLTWLWSTNVATDIAVSKSVNDAAPGIGDVVTFTLRVTNGGFAAATGLALADALPTGLVFVAASSGDYDANTGLWNVGALAIGATTSMTVQASVALPSETMPVLHGAVLTNTLAVAAMNQADLNPANNSASVQLTVVVKPRVLTVVSAQGTPVPSGVTTNPAGTTLTNTVASPVINGTTQYVCTGWALSTGEPASGTSNRVVMTPYQNTTLTWLWATNYRLDLAVSLVVDEPIRSTGQTALFTIGVTNRGVHPAGGIVVAELLPTNLLFQAAGSADYDANTGYWSIGTLAPGGATSLVVTVVMGGAPYAGGTATTNRVVLLSLNQLDTNAANDAASATISLPPPAADLSFDVITEHGVSVPPLGSSVFPAGTVMTNTITSPVIAGETQFVCIGWTMVGNEPASGVTNRFVCTLTNNATLTWLWTTNLGTDVHIAKTVDSPTPASGGFATYTVVASNRGPNPIVTLVVKDQLPTGLVFAASSSADYNPGTGFWNVGSIVAGASTSLTLDVLVAAPPGTALTNRATVYSLSATDTNVANDSASAVIVVGSSNVTLSVVSPYGVGTPSVGEHTNVAGSTVTASITSPVLVGSTQFVCTGWTLTGNTPVSGLTNTVSFVQGRSGVLTWQWQETLSPYLKVSKSVNNLAPGIGDVVTFRVSVTNQGNAGATGVLLSDMLPAGLAFEGSGSGYNPTTGVWSVGALAAGASASLAITTRVVVTSPRSITNQALVIALDQTDLAAPLGGATVVLNVGATQRQFTVISAHGSPALPVGIHVLDAGSTITNTVQASEVSPGLEYLCVGWTLTGGDAPASGTSNTMVTTIFRDGVLTWLWTTNIATDVSVSLAMTNTSPKLGDLVSLFLSVTNQGPQPATGLVLTNRMADALSFVSASSTGYVAATRRWTIGTLAPAASTSLTLVVALSNAPALVGLPLTNTVAIASLGVADTEPTNNVASVVFTPQATIPLWTLTVVSEHGTSSPAVGIHTNLDGSNVLLQATDQISGSTQYVCAGWSLTGLTTTSGGDNNTTLVQTNHVVFTWHWTTNYAFTAVAGFGGTTSVAQTWVPVGQVTSATAIAGTYFVFTNWTGDIAGGVSYANPITVTMDVPRTVQAVFTPLVTSNGVALWWLDHYGLTNDFELETTIDHDGDGQTTGEEFISLTDPTNAASYFKTGARSGVGGAVIQWSSISGRVYAIEGATALDVQDWLPVPAWTNLPATPPVNAVTNSATNGLLYFRTTGRLAP